MKTASAKAKGRKLQNEVREILLKYYGLEEGDIKTAIMGESGEDLILSPWAEKRIPFSIECKNTEKLNIWGAIKQAESNSDANRIPLVVFSRNRSQTYCVLEFEELLRLLGEYNIYEFKR